MSWTDERVELLKKMWGEGQSASQIAKELGGVTRNAVIGKVHRLGLSNRASTPSKSEAKAKPAAKAEAKPKAAPKPAEPVAKQAESPAPKPVPARKQIIPAGQPLPPVSFDKSMAMADMLQLLVTLTDFLITQEFLSIGVNSTISVRAPDFNDQRLVLRVQVTSPQCALANQQVVIECDHRCQDF